MTKGILVDVNYCTGCGSCIIACQMEHGYSENQFGIKVNSFGPVQIEGDQWEYDFVPQFTDWCDLCEERVETFGKMPTCVQHCQAQCLEYGAMEELASKLDGPKKILVAIK